MALAYDELVDFIAGGTSPSSLVKFQASQATQDRVADLIRREKADGLSLEERSELDNYLQLEHVLRLAKARARTRLSNDELRSE